MNVSPDALRKEVVTTLKEVNDQLKNFEEGDRGRIPLLSAKAQCLNSLVHLNARRP